MRMTSSIRLENEHLGSHLFDALREKDEAQALEEVRLKERELEQEAVHAFDDLLDASGSEASSYYKPPTSQQENGKFNEELLLRCQEELGKVREENDKLLSENLVLKANYDLVSKEKLKLEEKFEKSEVRINLLEQEIGELSDAQTVHRVKDQYETIIEKLKASFYHEKGEILAQLTKFKEEALLARNHVCATSEVHENQTKSSEAELESLKRTVEELRERELQLELMIKEQSMLLKENDLPEDLDENLAKLCELLRVNEKVFEKNSQPSCVLMNCYDEVVRLKNKLKDMDSQMTSSTRLCQELRVVATTLEKENQHLKEKLEHNNSDTESHSETTRVGTLKTALEKLEAENLHLRLQVQTVEENRDRLQTEIKNRMNQDSRTATDINDLLKEKERLLIDLKRAQEFSSQCRRAQEMAEEVLRKKLESFENEKDSLRRHIEMAANEKLQDEVRRMELQFADEVSQRSEIIEKLRQTCATMLEDRLAKICQEKDAEITNLTRKSQEEAEAMHERLTILQDEVEELRRETMQAVREKKEITAKFNQATEELETVKDEVLLKHDKLSRLRSQLEDLKIDRESRAVQLAEQEKRMQFLENLVKSSKNRVDRANKEKETIVKEYKMKLDLCLAELKTVNEELVQFRPGTLNQNQDQQKNYQVLEETCAKLVADLEQTRLKLKDSIEDSEKLRSALRHKIEVMQKIRGDLTVFQEQGRKYVTERKILLDNITRLEQDVNARRKRDDELKGAMGLITEKVIERLQARYRIG